MTTTTRRPYPFPRYEGDDEFIGRKHTEYSTANKSLNRSDNPDSWSRLYRTATLSSFRREPTYYDPHAPNDSLDFNLKTEYDNHREFLKDKHETVLQKETLGSANYRVLKNREIVVRRSEPSLGHPLRTVGSSRKENKNSVKTTLSGHHTQLTNVGYSRKPDGGFYTS